MKVIRTVIDKERKKTQSSLRVMEKMAWAVFLYLGNWEKSRPSLTAKSSSNGWKYWILESKMGYMKNREIEKEP